VNVREVLNGIFYVLWTGCQWKALPKDLPPKSTVHEIKGRKRHILVDTLGLLLNVVVHPAEIQDRDGAFHLLRRARRLFPFIERIFADGGYAGRKMAMTVWRTGAWSLQIVKRSDAAGFEVLPKRWIVTVCTMLPTCLIVMEACVGAHHLSRNVCCGSGAASAESARCNILWFPKIPSNRIRA
jgi:transposase